MALPRTRIPPEPRRSAHVPAGALANWLIELGLEDAKDEDPEMPATEPAGEAQKITPTP
ncbi:hypothetical protein [Kineosporia babensis]|uniref:Uncharacterized protein n=1 Tax=Kineosporia babensis TaxID=499548 RepID=A0A9X1NFL6_9ACTN|nr:hypothetical protein [Kineosporia babensis]MCD5312975.1 hypothetical protein [Kineosporia babensis]